MTWKLSFCVPSSSVHLFGTFLDAKGYYFSVFKNNKKKNVVKTSWVLELFFEDEAQKANIVSEIAVFSAFHKVDIGKNDISKIPDTDWLAESLSSFKPFSIDRFWIYGSHEKANIPSGSLGLCVNASKAFGTGEHGTTQGCLIALRDLQKSNSFSKLIMAHKRIPVLDVGCGTGILAMASVRLWNCFGIASDIDSNATMVAKDLIAQNGLSQKIKILELDGVSRREVISHAPYPLIIANILARPLCALARDFSRLLSQSGRMVLSGVLVDQVSMIVTHYRLHNVVLKRKYIRDEWATLVLGKQ